MSPQVSENRGYFFFYLFGAGAYNEAVLQRFYLTIRANIVFACFPSAKIDIGPCLAPAGRSIFPFSLRSALQGWLSRESYVTIRPLLSCSIERDRTLRLAIVAAPLKALHKLLKSPDLTYHIWGYFSSPKLLLKLFKTVIFQLNYTYAWYKANCTTPQNKFQHKIFNCRNIQL